MPVKNEIFKVHIKALIRQILFFTLDAPSDFLILVSLAGYPELKDFTERSSNGLNTKQQAWRQISV